MTGNYYDYPTCSDSVPSSDLTNPDPGNNANFDGNGPDPGGDTIGSPYWRTPVGEFENSESCYGTFDQGGNVWEWSEAVLDVSYRGARGGAFSWYDFALRAVERDSSYAPTNEPHNMGFRVANVADCNRNGILDECDLDCGTAGGPCDVPGCGQSTDENGNGVLDDCAPDIPTVSQWGVVAMTLLVLTAGTVVLARRRVAVQG